MPSIPTRCPACANAAHQAISSESTRTDKIHQLFTTWPSRLDRRRWSLRMNGVCPNGRTSSIILYGCSNIATGRQPDASQMACPVRCWTCRCLQDLHSASDIHFGFLQFLSPTLLKPVIGSWNTMDIGLMAVRKVDTKGLLVGECFPPDAKELLASMSCFVC